MTWVQHALGPLSGGGQTWDQPLVPACTRILVQGVLEVDLGFLRVLHCMIAVSNHAVTMRGTREVEEPNDPMVTRNRNYVMFQQSASGMVTRASPTTSRWRPALPTRLAVDLPMALPQLAIPNSTAKRPTNASSSVDRPAQKKRRRKARTGRIRG